MAPESQLPDIRQSATNGVHFLLDNWESIGLKTSDYILFGRSAGAYLGSQLLAVSNLPKPKAFVDFYGFATLFDADFKTKSNIYSAYPPVSDKQFSSMLTHTPIANGPISSRFLIYVYARQRNSWARLISPQSNSELVPPFHEFPPTYITHSTQDSDVPFTNALFFKKQLSESILVPINSSQHDWDREVSEQALQRYKKMIHWLNSVVQN